MLTLPALRAARSAVESGFPRLPGGWQGRRERRGLARRCIAEGWTCAVGWPACCCLPVARGLVVRDPEALERRQLICDGMGEFQASFDPGRCGLQWEQLPCLAADGLRRLESTHDQAHLEVSRQGRWLLRTIAAVFAPQQRVAARGARPL